MKDFCGNELQVNDEIVFIKMNKTKAKLYQSSHLCKGKITRFTEKFVFVCNTTGDNYPNEIGISPGRVVKISNQSTATQPIYGNDESDDILCPICKTSLGCVDSIEYFGKSKFCPECGQKLQWK